MSTVSVRQTGDGLTMEGVEVTGTFIVQTQHPAYPTLQLVVWRLSDGSWSFDALQADQYIGQIQPAGPYARGLQLLRVLRGDQP